MVSMSKKINEAAERGRLTCLYRSHQVPLIARGPFQRKTPESMSASRIRSLMNVEMVLILMCKTRSIVQLPSDQYALAVAMTDGEVQKTAYWVKEEIDPHHKGRKRHLRAKT